MDTSKFLENGYIQRVDPKRLSGYNKCPQKKVVSNMQYVIQYLNEDKVWTNLFDDFVIEIWSLSVAESIAKWAANSWLYDTEWLIMDMNGYMSQYKFVEQSHKSPFSQPNRLAHSGMGVKKG